MQIGVQSQDLMDELGFEAGYRLIRESGFTAIDWNLDHAWNFKDIRTAEKLEGLCIFERPLPEILDHYAEELEQIRKNGLSITQAHAPFPAYEAGRDDILEYAIGIYKNLILFCEAVGCPRVVIHGISIRQAEPESSTTEVCMARNYHLYESLIPTLQQVKNVTVCLENLFTRATAPGGGFLEGICSDPDEAVELIDTLNAKAGKKCFGLCLDTGHLNLLRKTFRHYLPILGDRIVALHIHDNSQENDSHLAPYTGTIRWSEFLREMKKIGYKGDLSFETFAQVRTNRIPVEMIPPFLTLIHSTGEYFRSQIEG